TATLLADGTVLVAGGDNGHGRSLGTAEVWDPRDGRFHAVGALGTCRYDHTATRLPSGKVLIAGGRHKNYSLRDWWTTFPVDTVVIVSGPFAMLFDPVARRWESVPGPAFERSGHSATLLPGGRILVVGGESSEDRPAPGRPGAELFQPPAPH